MKFFLFIILIIVSIHVDAQKKFTPKYQTIFDSSQAYSLLDQCSRSIPLNIQGSFTLTQLDINKLEIDFKKILSLKADSCCCIGCTIKDLNKYAYQYCGLIINGEKYLYVNAFQVTEMREMESRGYDWKKNSVVVCDGGDWFWGILFKLNNNTFSQFAINGEA